MNAPTVSRCFVNGLFIGGRGAFGTIATAIFKITVNAGK